MITLRRLDGSEDKSSAGIHQSTIIRHIHDYQAGKLKNESGGSSGQLTESQTEELPVHLEEHTYHHNHEIVIYIKERYGVSYTVSGMHKWLHRNGFSYKNLKVDPTRLMLNCKNSLLPNMKRLKKPLVMMSPFFLWTQYTQHKQQNSLMGG